MKRDDHGCNPWRLAAGVPGIGDRPRREMVCPTASQAARGFASGVTGKPIASTPQHLLYFRPEPQGQGAQRAIGAGAAGWVGGAAGSVAAVIGVASLLVSTGSDSTGPGRFQP